MDGSAGGVLFEELGELPLFGPGEMDGFANEGCQGARFQFDGVVPSPRWGKAFALPLFEDIAVVSVLEWDAV